MLAVFMNKLGNQRPDMLAELGAAKNPVMARPLLQMVLAHLFRNILAQILGSLGLADTANIVTRPSTVSNAVLVIASRFIGSPL